jgi:hypothetical protein
MVSAMMLDLVPAALGSCVCKPATLASLAGFHQHPIPSSGVRTPLAAFALQPRQVHINSRSMALENIEFMFCPRDRTVEVPVPVTLWNEEAAVGVRKGAWLHRMRRVLPDDAR